MKRGIDKIETNSFTHSVMFHHFHDDKHLPAQGSLSAEDFNVMISWLSDRYNLISAHHYLDKLENNALQEEDICLSFDDALLCQYDVVRPILKDKDIKAFFFVYSSAFTDDPDMLEIYRLFRTSSFDDVDVFYKYFFEIVSSTYEDISSSYAKFKSLDYLSADPFYSDNDRWFRYLRDQVLNQQQYGNIMLDMMNQKNFDVEEASRKLWMTERNLKTLYSEGHLIGLHSFSHPTQMSKLSRLKQQEQYLRNLNHLEGVLGKGSISSMSHPCGDYNNDTLELLIDMNIKIGFRSTPTYKYIKSPLEVPRNSHSNVLRAMKDEGYL